MIVRAMLFDILRYH